MKYGVLIFLGLLNCWSVVYASDNQSTSRNTIFNSVKNNSSLKTTDTVALKPIAPIVSEQKMMPVPKDIVSSPVITTIPAMPKVAPIAEKNESEQRPTFTVHDAIPKINTAVDAPLPKKIATVVPKAVAKVQPALKETIDVAKNTEINNQSEKESNLKFVSPEPIKLEPDVLYQQTGFVDDHTASIAFNFEEANLPNLLNYIEMVHKVKFITDDAITGLAVQPKGNVAGHKISFRTNHNLTRKESWDLFLTFMHIAGLDVIPLPTPSFYRVVSLAKAGTEPIPTYIGVSPDVLPDSDMIVRYAYFTRNISPAKIQPILSKMQSASSKLDVYTDLKGLIFTDRASSIKSLMRIVQELDNAVLPEALTVIKLKRANVGDVKALYESLKPGASRSAADQGTVPTMSFSPIKKESTLEYFPADVVLVSDHRTNSLIVLGTAKDVAKVEEFITKHIDVPADRKIVPLYTYKLQYTNATDIAATLNQIITYNASSQTVGQYGGVRDGVRFFQSGTMTITPDAFTNTLIINASQEDYNALLPLIKDLDIAQKQIGLEVLIVQVKDADVKTLGTQLSGPNGFNTPVANNPNTFGPTFGGAFSAQTSGVPAGTPIVVTGGSTGTDDLSIKSSLASLLGSSVLNQVGSVLVTFGKPIWAIFKILNTITSTHIVQNPFVVVSNNCTASIKSGEVRRLVQGAVLNNSGTPSETVKGFTPVEATLNITIIPQINKANMINLSIDVSNNDFQQDSASVADLNKGSIIDSKEVKTKVTVANGETLVLGGIMTESYSSSAGGVPFLERIPLVGWLFKSKTKTVSKNHFMIFICPRLLDPIHENSSVDPYTNYKLKEVQQHLDVIDQADWFVNQKDPIQKAFFKDQQSPSLQQLHITNVYQQRENMDGKIDNRKPSRKKTKKSEVVTMAAPRKSNRKSKKGEVVKSVAPAMVVPEYTRNAILYSVQQPGENR